MDLQIQQPRARLEIPVWESLVHKQQLDPWEWVRSPKHSAQGEKRVKLKPRCMCQHLEGGQRWADHREDSSREGQIRKKEGNSSVAYGILEVKERLEIDELVKCY